jgi:hypothetical protein
MSEAGSFSQTAASSVGQFHIDFHIPILTLNHLCINVITSQLFDNSCRKLLRRRFASQVSCGPFALCDGLPQSPRLTYVQREKKVTYG